MSSDRKSESVQRIRITLGLSFNISTADVSCKFKTFLFQCVWMNIENHRLPDGEYTAIFSLSSSSSETHCCLREIRSQIRCWSVIVGFHCLCDCRLSVRKRLQKLLTSCSCRNRPSSSVTALDLSASCFCTLIIVTLSLTCDLRHTTHECYWEFMCDTLSCKCV